MDVIQAFEECATRVDSTAFDLSSNDVLAVIRPNLQSRGFRVEQSKLAADRLRVPVLFGRNGQVQKAFDADAWNVERRMVLEVEAGRGVLNNQFLKDLFQACMMQSVEYFGVAVRNVYKRVADFETVETFFDTLYASRRLELPLKGILVLGY